VAAATRVAPSSFFSTDLVRRLGAQLARVEPSFPERAFVEDACRNLRRLGLLDRGRQIASALGTHLPPAYPDAIAVLLSSLGPELAIEDLVGVGMAPFFYLPHAIFISERGLEHFDLSLRAQYELTKRFSAEMSIRPFIAKDPERTFSVLREWTKDPNPHVRRLVSEGTRLRLPWATRVAWLDANPQRVVELLELLKDDPSRMVCRSVANSLNDVAKVRPDLAVEAARRWSTAAIPARRWIVRHALRFLVKKGHRGALEVLGVAHEPLFTIEGVHLAPASLAIGGELRFAFQIMSTSKRTQALLIDYAVHFVKASGDRRPKLFRLRFVTLPPAGRLELGARVSFENMTTRRHYPGRHRIDVVVNGVAQTLGEFDVLR
jgi:3-methyladenine DNA glycosylase AlkC